MGMIATLSGHRVTSAQVHIPAWGCWYAEATIDGEVELSGKVELVLADLKLSGCILSGSVSNGRAAYRIVGGSGGWGKTIARRSYANDAGVRLATVLVDAAADAGETFDVSTVAQADRVGPAYARPEEPAVRLLERLAPGAWYIGEDGVTRLGRRPLTPLSVPATRTQIDRARAKVVLATSSIASIVPGVVVDGIESVDVLHEIGAEGGLRSTVWGAVDGGSSRAATAMRDIIEQLDPERRFRGVTEYRVVTIEGKRVNLQPVRVSTGMPDLRRVLARPGVPGAYGMALLGSRVLVGFVDSDESRPYVASFEDAEGEGFAPTNVSLDAVLDVKLGQALAYVVRSGDLVNIPGVMPGPGVASIPLTLSPAVMAAPGAPGIGHSKVSA